MHIRYLKIMFAAITGCMALVYVLQNFANIDAAHGALAYVMGGADHAAYPDTFAFKTANPALAWFALALVCLGELAAGLLMLKGTFDMWTSRREGAESFQASKKWAEIGAGVGVLVWLGFFDA